MSSPMTEPFNNTITTPSNHILKSIFSYNGNIMIAAIISLLIVILFVLLLHVYAQWFLAQARQRRQSSMHVSHVLAPTQFHTFTFDTSLSASSPTKGLDPSVIAAIPLFVYNSDEHYKNDMNLECVVCLSTFEDNDIGRNLPKCHHVFHVECIDMWLQSHSSCPVCRAPAVWENKGDLTHDQASNIDVDSAEDCSETVSGDGDSGHEILIDLWNYGNENEGSQSSLAAVPASPCISSHQSLPSSSLGCSLKRMLSRNRSEHKVFPALNGESQLN